PAGCRRPAPAGPQPRSARVHARRQWTRRMNPPPTPCASHRAAPTPHAVRGRDGAAASRPVGARAPVPGTDTPGGNAGPTRALGGPPAAPLTDAPPQAPVPDAQTNDDALRFSRFFVFS